VWRVCAVAVHKGQKKGVYNNLSWLRFTNLQLLWIELLEVLVNATVQYLIFDDSVPQCLQIPFLKFRSFSLALSQLYEISEYNRT
jgi:hypothetical protein